MFYKLSEFKNKRKSHKHIAMIVNGQPTGLCSEDADHRHDILFNDAIQNYEVLEANGHTHIVEEQIGTGSVLESADEKDYIEEGWSLFDQALSRESECIEEAEDNIEFYKGGFRQWDAEVREKIKKTKAMLSINLVGALVDRLHGIFLQSLPDITVYPVTDGDEVVADIIQKVMKFILQNNNQKELFGNLFLDELITGKGVCAIEVTKNNNLENEIKIRRSCYDKVLFGDHKEQTLSDCDYIIKYTYLSKNDIKFLYPEKWEDLETSLDNLRGVESTHTQVKPDQYDIGKHQSSILARGVKPFDDYSKNYLVFEVERKINYTKFMVNIGETYIPMVLDSYEIKAIRSLGVQIEKTIDYTIRRDVICGDVLIDSYDTDSKFFSVIPFYAKFVDGQWFSKISDGKDLNKSINKRASQLDNIMNKVAAYNYFIDQETFGGNVVEETNFRKNSAKSGQVFKVATISNTPQMTQGVKYPSEIAQAEEDCYRRLSIIFGEVPQLAGSGFSSRGLLQMQRYNMSTNEHLFENFNSGLKILGRLLVEHIRLYFTPQQILRIIRDVRPGEEKTPYESMEDNEILKLLLETDLGKYDIQISTGKYSETFKEAVFESLQPLVTNGMLPASTLIEASSLPDKNKLLESIRQQQEQEAQSQKSAEDSESRKVIYSKNIDPNTMLPLSVLSYQAMIQNGISPEIAQQFMQTLK